MFSTVIKSSLLGLAVEISTRIWMLPVPRLTMRPVLNLYD